MTDTPKDDRDIEARKYRKKPVLIEAIQLTSDVAQFWRVYEFMRSDVQEWDDEPFRIRIRTLEGEMWATEGDWVIKGVQGEFYPCKPDIFAQTYESAARPAPEALGAAKGELSDAEIEEFVAPLIQEHLSGYARQYVTYNDGRSNNRVTSDMRNLTRAILAKAKDQS